MINQYKAAFMSKFALSTLWNRFVRFDAFSNDRKRESISVLQSDWLHILNTVRSLVSLFSIIKRFFSPTNNYEEKHVKELYHQFWNICFCKIQICTGRQKIVLIDSFVFYNNTKRINSSWQLITQRQLRTFLYFSLIKFIIKIFFFIIFHSLQLLKKTFFY